MPGKDVALAERLVRFLAELSCPPAETLADMTRSSLPKLALLLKFY